VEAVLLIELLCAVLVLAFCLTGRRGEFLDSIHPRADAMLVVLLVLCALFYAITLVKMTNS